MEKTPEHVEVPQDAKFVIYKFPGTSSTIQQTLDIHMARTWKAIKEADLSKNSYGVVFKDKEYNISPITYVIRGELKDILELDDDNINDSFEEAQASTALASTGLTTYIKAELKNLLAYIAFDPKTMVMVADEEEKETPEEEKETPEEKEKTPEVPYTPVNIPRDFGVLRRDEAYYVNENMDGPTLCEQPFISRSNEKASIDFVAEYFNYCCDPTQYPGTEVKTMPYDQERFDITPKVLQHMQDKTGTDFSTLKVHQFFEKINDYKGDVYRPTHDLLCHMFLMNRLASVPFYLARGHLGNPEKATQQLEYYTNFIIHNNPNVIPNQAGVIEFLQRILTVIKNGAPGRLMEIEMDVGNFIDLLSKGPYEELMREQFCLVNNITEGDTVGFKLTPTGAMFLYMCCPNVM